MLSAADRRLTEVRRTVPDAGGLVIATDQDNARAYAAHLQRDHRQAPAVVLSDDEGASGRIEEFAQGDDRWMVAVRMVSEGVDVPRLAVGVYATSASTPLYFAQAVGRFVRARKRGETASIFLPSVAPLLNLAGTMEQERDHALDRPRTAEEQGIEYDPEAALVAEANKEEKASSELLGSFQALEAQASFDRVLFDGGEFGTSADLGSAEEQDFLGLPGLLEPDQVATLLRQRQADHLKARGGAPTAREVGGRALGAGASSRGRAAQGAVQARLGLGQAQRAAARHGARRAAPHVRRAGGAARDRRPARRARGPGPALVRGTEVALAEKQSTERQK